MNDLLRFLPKKKKTTKKHFFTFFLSYADISLGIGTGNNL
jgi:hypothetical protein